MGGSSGSRINGNGNGNGNGGRVRARVGNGPVHSEVIGYGHNNNNRSGETTLKVTDEDLNRLLAMSFDASTDESGEQMDI